MTRVFWSEFAILLTAALLGGLAIIPYSLRLLSSSQRKPLKFSLPTLLLLSFLQTAVLSALAIGLGLLAAHASGLGAPYIEAALARNGSIQAVVQMLPPAVGFGVLGGAVLLLLDLLFLPYWPQELVDFAQRTTLWENFLASFYGGLNEEFFMRLFGFSVLTWLLSSVWYTPAGLPTDAVFWTANVTIAVLFGLGHLPAAKNLLGSIPPLMLARMLLLNAPIGLICGWLFWTYGIEAAVLAHFSADIVYHVAGTIVLRSKLTARTAKR
jgi:Type II CAAX prenyl endopeptidase Rce1-like